GPSIRCTKKWKTMTSTPQAVMADRKTSSSTTAPRSRPSVGQRQPVRTTNKRANKLGPASKPQTKAGCERSQPAFLIVSPVDYGVVSTNSRRPYAVRISQCADLIDRCRIENVRFVEL